MTGPPTVMRSEHVQLRAMKQSVRDAPKAMLESGSDKSWVALVSVGRHCFKLFRSHIAKENNILYPMAMKFLQDNEEWNEMGKKGDAIGYLPGHGK